MKQAASRPLSLWALAGLVPMAAAIATAQPITPVDVVGHVPLFEFQNYIAPAGLNDWGGEPSLAVNPLDPNKVAISTFCGNTPGAPLWYTQDGGTTWGFRKPISSVGSGGPNDQSIAYDKNGILHMAMLDFSVNVYHGQTADPNLDGRDGRGASVWQWTNGGSRVNLQGASQADQPWLAVGTQVGNPNQVAVHVGYDVFSGSSVQMRASKSVNGGSTFVTDNQISNGFVTPVNANPGLRITMDGVGRVYSIFGWGDTVLANNDKHVRYAINRDSGAAGGWDFTSSASPGGLVVDDGNAHVAPGNKFGNVNALLGNATTIAVTQSGDHVYAVYGKQPTGSTVDRLWVREFHPDPSNPANLLGSTPVMFSAGTLQSEIPNAAVTDDGKLWVQYDQYNPANNTFSVHLSSSTDLGQTWSDQTVYSFIPPIADNGDPRQRIIGDYQNLKAVGNSVFGTFCARGNVNAGGINTTNWMVPFYYSVPTPGSALALGLGGLALVRRRRRA